MSVKVQDWTFTNCTLITHTPLRGGAPVVAAAFCQECSRPLVEVTGPTAVTPGHGYALVFGGILVGACPHETP